MTGIPPSWARVGAKVVCIDAESSRGRFVPHNVLGIWDGILVEGGVYTIESFAMHWVFPELPCVHLSEVSRPSNEPLALRRFRPLHTLRKDVRAIKSALRDMPVTERLDRLMELLDEDERA